MNQPPATKPPRTLPARAKWIFVLTAVLVSACFVARRPGARLETWQKWLIDAPMLVMVALSSLIWATWRQGSLSPVNDRPNRTELHQEDMTHENEPA